jgi:hypothetical protein
MQNSGCKPNAELPYQENYHCKVKKEVVYYAIFIQAIEDELSFICI